MTRVWYMYFEQKQASTLKELRLIGWELRALLYRAHSESRTSKEPIEGVRQADESMRQPKATTLVYGSLRSSPVTHDAFPAVHRAGVPQADMDMRK